MYRIEQRCVRGDGDGGGGRSGRQQRRRHRGGPRPLATRHRPHTRAWREASVGGGEKWEIAGSEVAVNTWRGARVCRKRRFYCQNRSDDRKYEAIRPTSQLHTHNSRAFSCAFHHVHTNCIYTLKCRRPLASRRHSTRRPPRVVTRERKLPPHTNTHKSQQMSAQINSKASKCARDT